MIPKILFLALFCAAHVQGRPASSPHENPDRVVNTWSDVGNTDYVNNNFNPNDSGKYNSDVNAGHDVVIVNSPPNVNKREETNHEATNDNTNNIPVDHRAPPTAMKKIVTAKPVIEIGLETNLFKGRLASSPHENPNRVVNVWNGVVNTNHVKENFSPNDSGYHNSDVNAGRNVLIVNSHADVNKKEETYHEATNDNANIHVNHRTPTIVMKKIVTAKPVIGIDVETNLFKGRPANSPHENSHRVVNVWNEVDDTNHVKENFSPNDGGYHNSDLNAGHNVVIVSSHPEVYKKIETKQTAPNDNADYILVHHRAPTVVKEKIVVAGPVTGERTQKSPVVEFADKFGHALGVVAEDNVHNVGKGLESVFDVGRSVAGAAGTRHDAKAEVVVPVPRVKASFFGAFG